MRTITSLFILALACPATASAGVFKCTDGRGHTIYQDHACAGEGQSLDVRSDEPTARDRQQGQTRQRRQQQLVEEYETELARSRTAAELDRKRQADERRELDAHCARYEEKIADARRGDKSRQRSSSNQTASLRALEAKHFSECFGRR